ncbi:AbrB/MazE/SpoVT family DNA-binding domain-containing protein [Acetonema longum]|uniref:AbrB family transcriptional regulator n=1 Tax=Acetonema longum DSM 6540 TaxID=1009370 RepID=F7NK98_9FIRM|nr:AbrB/MazE/SpoVT family DNA-binding domain-containing protein [Acetonema longum]EGO63539.1 AbrB family transcriptional regulator [Acetonema longum DSM 6540]
MKATGIVRELDDLGRIVIPKELRRIYGIDTGTPIEIFTDNDKIILRKYSQVCAACNHPEVVKEIGHIGLCQKCVGQVKQ